MHTHTHTAFYGSTERVYLSVCLGPVMDLQVWGGTLCYSVLSTHTHTHTHPPSHVTQSVHCPRGVITGAAAIRQDQRMLPVQDVVFFPSPSPPLLSPPLLSFPLLSSPLLCSPLLSSPLLCSALLFSSLFLCLFCLLSLPIRLQRFPGSQCRGKQQVQISSSQHRVQPSTFISQAREQPSALSTEPSL